MSLHLSSDGLGSQWSGLNKGIMGLGFLLLQLWRQLTKWQKHRQAIQLGQRQWEGGHGQGPVGFLFDEGVVVTARQVATSSKVRLMQNNLVCQAGS